MLFSFPCPERSNRKRRVKIIQLQEVCGAQNSRSGSRLSQKQISVRKPSSITSIAASSVRFRPFLQPNKSNSFAFRGFVVVCQSVKVISNGDGWRLITFSPPRASMSGGSPADPPPAANQRGLAS